TQQRNWIVVQLPPADRVDFTEQLIVLRVPGPPEIVGQRSQLLIDRIGIMKLRICGVGCPRLRKRDRHVAFAHRETETDSFKQRSKHGWGTASTARRIADLLCYG